MLLFLIGLSIYFSVKSIKFRNTVFREIVFSSVETCSICLDETKEIAWIQTLCGHRFHKECIEKWIAQKTNCPLCRNTIQV